MSLGLLTEPESTVAAPIHATHRRSAFWLLLGAVFIPCIYVRMLAAPFDFTDDSVFVYDSVHPHRSLAEHLSTLGDRIQNDFEHLGVYFPTNRIHRYVRGELLGTVAWRWRVERLLWSMVACAAWLWLLRELGVPPLPALLVTFAAFANPFRNEIWMMLISGEGEGMPYAMVALACAVRAARSSLVSGGVLSGEWSESQLPLTTHRSPLINTGWTWSWLWDLAAFLAALLAMGCKPTFSAMVPAQVLLRIAPDGRDFRAGWRRHWPQAVFLGSTLLWPVLLTVLHHLHWQEGHYQAGGASVRQVWEMALIIWKGLSLTFLAPGLLLALLVVGWQRLGEVAGHFRGACFAGLALLVFGAGVYLPVGTAAPRYCIPAVWGGDILLAALLTALAEKPGLLEKPSFWLRRTSYLVLGCGLLAALLVNVNRQDKLAARSTLLWQAVEIIAQQAPPGSKVIWMNDSMGGEGEGYHFDIHLRHATAGRAQLYLVSGESSVVSGKYGSDHSPLTTRDSLSCLFAVSGTASPPGADWQLIRTCNIAHRPESRFRCFVWRRGELVSGEW